MSNNSFYTEAELKQIGFKSFGKNVLISKKVSIYKPEVIFLGNNIRIDDFCILSGGKGIEFGDFIHVGCYSALFGGSGITIEDFSNISGRVSIYSESDDFSGASMTNPLIPLVYKPLYCRGEVILKRHALVGTNSTILPGVTLGEGAAVGAHSLVKDNCDPWTIYFGNPVRKRERSRQVLELEQDFLRSIT